jgi:hypothetical protein
VPQEVQNYFMVLGTVTYVISVFKHIPTTVSGQTGSKCAALKQIRIFLREGQLDKKML